MTNDGFSTTIDGVQVNAWTTTPKHLPKPALHQRKVMVTVWWAAASLFHHSFLTPSATIAKECKKLDKTHQILHRDDQQKMLNPTSSAVFTDDHKKVVWVGVWNSRTFFIYPSIPLAYRPSLFQASQHFPLPKCFRNQDGAKKKTFHDSVTFRTLELYAIGISKPVLHWQKLWLKNFTWSEL